MMRDILSGCLLPWHEEIPKKCNPKTHPKLALHEHIIGINQDHSEGYAIIYDCDGSKWKAPYKNKSEIDHDWQLLIEAHKQRVNS